MLYRSDNHGDPYTRYLRHARVERARAFSHLFAIVARTVSPPVRALGRTVVNAVRSLAKRLAEAHRRRAAMRELQGFDDRILADIGISRSQIAAAVLVGRPPDEAPKEPSAKPRRFRLIINRATKVKATPPRSRKAA